MFSFHPFHLAVPLSRALVSISVRSCRNSFLYYVIAGYLPVVLLLLLMLLLPFLFQVTAVYGTPSGVREMKIGLINSKKSFCRYCCCWRCFRRENPTIGLPIGTLTLQAIFY